MVSTITRLTTLLFAASAALAMPIAQDDGSGSTTDCVAESETVTFDDASNPSKLLAFPYFTIQSPEASANFKTLLPADSHPNVAISTKSLSPNPNLVGTFSAAGDYDFTLHSLTLAASADQVASMAHGMGWVQARIDCLGADYNDNRGSKYQWFNAKLSTVDFDTVEADKKAFAKCRQIRISMYSSDGHWDIFALGGVNVTKVCP